MNILHLAPDLQAGGASDLALELANSLQRGGRTRNLLISPAIEPANSLDPGVRHIACHSSVPWGLLFGISGLRRHILSHRTDFVLAYGARAAWEARRCCKKIPAALRPKIIGVATTYPHIGTTARGLACCDAFTTISRHLHEVLEDYSPIVRRKGSWVIPYGVRETQCYPTYGPSADWLARWRRLYPADSAKQPTICLPGAITPRHGHEDLVPLLAALHRFGVRPRILIAGDESKADPAYLQRLNRLFDQTNISKDILWIGARKDMRDVYCVSDFVISLNKEPAVYDRAVLEALALGCPVAVYDHGAVGEMLTAFLPEGRVVPGKPEQVADTLYQWSIYHPDTVSSIPYPYRMADTAANYMTLFHSLAAPHAPEREDTAATTDTPDPHE